MNQLNVFRSVTATLIILVAGQTRAAEKPNIVIIFNDDQGYQDLGCFGSPDIRTPRVDQMAREGMKLTDFYVASPVCSSYGIPYSNDMSPAKEMKYAEACLFLEGQSLQTLKEAFAGELKNGSPKSLKNKVPLMRNTECIEFPADQATITRRFADEGIEFISESVNAGSPFFLHLANSMPHTPLHASPLARAELPEVEFDGRDILDLLTVKEGASTPHQYFFYVKTGVAVRSGDWKYHKKKHFTTMGEGRDMVEPALYNLKDDIGEANNVIDEFPGIAERMALALGEHLQRIDK